MSRKRRLHHRPLNIAADFRDDGGTRAWRANQATYGRHVIDVEPPGARAAIRRWWRETPLWKLMLLAFLVSYGLPMAILVVGILGMWAWFSVGW